MSAPAETPARPAPPRREASLLPREHGAWGQLALPLASGLALGRPAPAALLLVVAVVLAFLAHEPLIVLLGQRGVRHRDEQGRRAWRALVALAAGALGTGALGLAIAPPQVVIPALASAGLLAIAAQLAFLRLEKTTAGELVVASALATFAAPVALAGGAPQAWAAAAAVTWVVAFAIATVAVRAVVLRARTRGDVDRRPQAAAAVVVLVGAALYSASHAWLPWTAALAPLPVAAVALALTATSVPPQRLPAVGWSLAGASVVSLVALVAGLRL